VDNEGWAVDKRRIQGFEMTAYRRLLGVSCTAHRTNASVLQEIQPQEPLLTTVQRRKLQYFGHVIRARNLCIEILEGRLDGKRRRGRPRRRWTRGVVKQNSGRMFTVGTGQATMETVGARSDLRSSATRRKQSSKHCAPAVCRVYRQRSRL